MRLSSLLVVFFVLLLSAPARAQSGKLADFVGTWVGGQADSTGKAVQTKDTLILRADSTYSRGGGKFARWGRVAGDTVVYGSGVGYRLTLKDQQLSMTGLGTNKGDNYVYVLVLLPAPARAQSVKLADLVGTWTRSDTTIKDTLVFRSDSTTNWHAPNSMTIFHPIHRLKGDTIQFIAGGRNFKITLKDQQFTVITDMDNGSLPKGVFKFKRVDAPTPKP